MPIITVTQPAPGDPQLVAGVNDQINTILATVNGDLDDDNIASLSGDKLVAGTVPLSAFDSSAKTGWITDDLPAPNSVTYNGNGSYSLVFNSVDLTSKVGNGTRIRTTRTVIAPNKCADLETSSSHYFVNTSPANMTFTDDFCISVWAKLESYAGGTIVSRYNGTSGWVLSISPTTGQVVLSGFNAGSSNASNIVSVESIPLGEWVHITAQLDMSSFTVSSTTSYIMINGTDVPAKVARAGTNPTSLIQAGDFEVGSYNGGTAPLDGKIAQLAVYATKVTQSSIRATISQGLSGAESNLISAYSFNNSLSDLNGATGNNLTAMNSAVATDTDSPFGVQGDNTISTTKDYGLVMRTSFSTNTTIVIQVPNGCTIPTSGGVSSVDYSTHKIPYNFPSKSRWSVKTLIIPDTVQSSVTSSTTYNPDNAKITIPIGSFDVEFRLVAKLTGSTSAEKDIFIGLSTSQSSLTDFLLYSHFWIEGAIIRLTQILPATPLELETATVYFIDVLGSGSGTLSDIGFSSGVVKATPNNL